MQHWKYRVIGSEIIDSESGKALSLGQAAKLLNEVPSVQQQCKDAQDSLNKAMDKLDDVALDERPGDNFMLVAEAIAFGIVEVMSKKTLSTTVNFHFLGRGKPLPYLLED